MHQIHGYREVGNYRDHLYKNGQYYDVIFLIELLAEDWCKLKNINVVLLSLLNTFFNNFHLG